jgi:hypothetical protein
MMGLKQEALAELLGDDWLQKKVSYLETRETIEPELRKVVRSIIEDRARKGSVAGEDVGR